MPKAYVTVGLPRSGKSTYVKEHLSGIVKVSADQLRLLIHGQRFRADEEVFVWKVRDIMLKAICEQGLDVVIDGTNVTKKQRGKSIKLAKQFGYRTVAIVVPTEKAICQKRAKDTGQADLIPVIENMAAKYEPVTEDEGFDEVKVIRTSL